MRDIRGSECRFGRLCCVLLLCTTVRREQIAGEG